MDYTTSDVWAFSAVVWSAIGEIGAIESRRRDEISMEEFSRVKAGVDERDEGSDDGTEEIELSE